MTTKQRSKLRSLAQNIEPVGQVGKGGLSENMISGLSDALDALKGFIAADRRCAEQR